MGDAGVLNRAPKGRGNGTERNGNAMGNAMGNATGNAMGNAVLSYGIVDDSAIFTGSN